MIIEVDTREQLPWEFESVRSSCVPWSTEGSHLKTCDYRVKEFPNAIGIERKSLSDLYGCFARGRGRFVRELRRMSEEYTYAAVVCESDWTGLVEATELFKRPKIHPRSAVGSVIAWTIRHGVHFHFCPGREFAEQLAFRLLERAYRDETKKAEPGNGSP